jgi:hypothetical protein
MARPFLSRERRSSVLFLALPVGGPVSLSASMPFLLPFLFIRIICYVTKKDGWGLERAMLVATCATPSLWAPHCLAVPEKKPNNENGR